MSPASLAHALLSGPRPADVVLAALPIEFAVLTLRPGARRDRTACLDRLFALLPAAFLALALRAALVGSGPLWVGLCLLLSLPVHLLDLRRRRI